MFVRFHASVSFRYDELGVFKHEDTTHLIRLPCSARVNKIPRKLAVFKSGVLYALFIGYRSIDYFDGDGQSAMSIPRQLFSSKGSKILKVSQWGFDILLHAWTLSISIRYRTPQNIDILSLTDRIRLSKSFPYEELKNSRYAREINS